MQRFSKQGLAGRCLAVVSAAIAAVSHPAHAEDWIPIDADDLKMTAVPQAPGAAAIFLYRQIDRDDSTNVESVYNRIKILTDEGREFGNVQIEYEKSQEAITGIEARTIEPDGRIVNFSGTVIDKPVMEARQTKVMQKTLTLPELHAGCIVEYRYRHHLRDRYIFDSHWILNDSLYTRYAKFTLTPYTGFSLRWSWPVGLPGNSTPPSMKNGKIRYEARDIPAFITEEWMPPDNELKMRVDFIYDDSPALERDPDKFWKAYGKKTYKDLERFTDEKRTMQQALAGIIAAGDSDETKVRKIYACVLALRNLSFEREKTREEADRAGEKAAHDVGDIWNHGYADGVQLTWLFLALVRAAGLDADPVMVSTRDKYFFNRRGMTSSQLNSNVVIVKLNGKELFLDPGVPSTPFGMLPWNETGVVGLRLDKNGGTWIETPLPKGEESQLLRTADLKMDRSGTLEGKLTVMYTGIEALWRRLQERDEDAADRKEFLEQQIKQSLASGADVTLIAQPDWMGSDASMTATFDLRVPGWAQVAGQRALLGAGLFGADEKHAFQHGTRHQPIYFKFPHESIDIVNVELPLGWQATTVPAAHQQSSAVASSLLAVDAQGNTVRITRDINIRFIILEAKFYGYVQGFYAGVRSGDEEQIVITTGKATASN